MLKRSVTYLLMFIVVLGSSWALLRPEFFRIHDYVHAARVVEMARALEDGHIPPRWSQSFGYGYGMPLFEFYAPLPYIFGALLLLTGIPMIIVLKILFIVCNVLTALGGYKLGKYFDGRIGGLLVATLLTLAPYRAVNLYVRGAVSEAWGIMTIPWILYGILAVYSQKKVGWLIITLATAALLLSHNLTSIIALPTIASMIVLAILLNVLSKKKSKKERSNVLKTITKQTAVVFGSLVLAFGLSAFYTIPAVAEKQHTKVEQAVTTGYFDYSLHFLYLRQLVTDDWGYGGSGWGPDDEISFYFGSAQLLALLLMAVTGVVLMGKGVYQRSFSQRQLMILATLIGLGVILSFNIFMTTPKSLFIWQMITNLKFIQFPWRWLSAGIVGVALLGGLSLSLISNQKKRYCLGLALIIFAISLNTRYFQPEQYLNEFDSLYYTDTQTISKSMSNILYDYMPTKVPLTIVPPQNFVSCFFENVNFNQGCDSSKLLLDRVHEKLFTITTTEERLVTVALADFPGWQVELNGQPLDHRANSNGLIEFTVPKGESTIGLYFGNTPTRLLADLVTIISGFTLLYLLIPYMIKKEAIQDARKNRNS